MKGWLSSVALLAALLTLAACAAKEGAPAPAAAPEPAAPAQPAWQEEWERLVAAAKREGRVAVVGPTGANIRRALTETFEKRYGITVEYLGQRGAEFPPRLRTERAAGQYLWDIFSGGPAYIVPFKEIGALDPIEPALVLPEVKEPKSWRGKGIYFIDETRLMVAMSIYTSGFWYYNPSQVRAEEFKSWKDLLDPKWKGKVLLSDPRSPGTGQSRFMFFYQHPQLGADFIRALAPQLVPTRDADLELQWIATGRYPITIGASETLAEEKIQQGLPIGRLDPKQLREGAYVASGVSNVVLLNKAPHPNAAKLYLNWLLSKEGQTELSRASGLPSWRADVPTDHITPAKLPVEGYISQASEAAQLLQERIVRLARELLGE